MEEGRWTPARAVASFHTSSRRVRSSGVAAVSEMCGVTLTTPDMDATVRFYVGLLRLRIVETASYLGVRRYVFACGSTRLVFVESAFARGAQSRADHPAHASESSERLTFCLDSVDDLLATRARLIQGGCRAGELVVRRGAHVVCTVDPTGIAVELVLRPVCVDDPGPPVLHDPDPVPAVFEVICTVPDATRPQSSPAPGRAAADAMGAESDAMRRGLQEATTQIDVEVASTGGPNAEGAGASSSTVATAGGDGESWLEYLACPIVAGVLKHMLIERRDDRRPLSSEPWPADDG